MRELQLGKKTRCGRRFYFAICIKALSYLRLAATATKGNPASHHDCMNFDLHKMPVKEGCRTHFTPASGSERTWPSYRPGFHSAYHFATRGVSRVGEGSDQVNHAAIPIAIPAQKMSCYHTVMYLLCKWIPQDLLCSKCASYAVGKESPSIPASRLPAIQLANTMRIDMNNILKSNTNGS